MIRKMKTLWIVGLLIGSLVIMPVTSHAVFGIGDIVFDPTAFAQMLLEAFWWVEDLAYQVEQIANQVVQIEQGVIMLENWALSLKNLDFNIVNSMGGAMAKTGELFSKAKNIFFDAALIKEKFEELYRFDGDLMPSAEYFTKAFDWNKTVREAHVLATQQQAFLNKHLNNVVGTAWKALWYSEHAEGHLQAQQAGNGLIGVTIGQLNDTNALLGTMAHGQSVRDMQEASALDQALKRLEQVMEGWTEWTKTGGLSSLPTSFK